MAVEYYLKLDDLKGESKGDKHKDEIDILSFSWGASQPGLGHLGGGTGAGKVDIHDLQLTHCVDKASPMLFQGCCKGTPFTKATLTCRKAGHNALDYLTITMETVLIGSVQSGGHGSAAGSTDHPQESFSLHFQKFKVVYKEQDEKGAVKSSPEFSWDIVANAAV